MIFLLIYFIILFLFLFLKSQGKDKQDNFYLAGSKRSSIGIAFSLLATILGASSTIGVVSLSYDIGLPASWWLLMGAAGLITLYFLYAKYPFSEKNITFPEFFGAVYGNNVKKVISIIILISWIGIIAAQILALERVMEFFFIGSHCKAVVLIAVFVFIFYTAIGGQSAIIFTDIIQCILIIIGIIALNIILFLKIKFNFTEIPREYLSFPLNNYFTIKDLLYFLAVLLPLYLIGPDIHSRLFLNSNVKVRKRALLLSGSILIPLGFLISTLGVVAHFFYPQIVSRDNILFLLVKEISQNRFLLNLILISLISILFSSADTCLMTAATIFTRDILGIRNEKSITISRINIVSIGILSYVLSRYSNGIIEILLSSYSFYAAGVLVPFLLIPLRKRLKIKNKAVFIAVIIIGVLSVLSNIFKIKFTIFYLYSLSLLIIILFSYVKRK